MFDSPDTLAKVIDGINEQVIEEVSFKILMLLQEMIERDVYKSGNPSGSTFNKLYYNGTHQPTGEFMLAFKWKDMRVKIRNITRELFYDYESMGYDPDTFLHGDPELKDLRKDLADILNVEGYDDQNAFGGKERKPYWDNFIEELFDNEMIDAWFDEEFLKFGITRT